MRYIVIGAGSVGGTVGGQLARAGHDVVLVGRGAHLAALRADGLTVGTPGGTFTVRPPAIAGPDELTLGPADALLLATKTQDSVRAVELWGSQPVPGAGLAGAVLPVFCFTNGVENERVAARRFAAVYGVGVQLPAELIAPGQVLASGAPVSGVLEIGRYPAGSGPAAGQLAADLNGAGFRASVTEDVMRFKYTKLLRNLRNAIIAACGSASAEPARRLGDMAEAEALACYAAAGIASFDPGAARSARDDAMTDQPVNGRIRGGGSSWQSLNRGAGSIETDYLNGEIVLLGRLHGVPTPVNELLRQTANQLAAAHQPPGSLDPGELLGRVTSG